MSGPGIQFRRTPNLAKVDAHTWGKITQHARKRGDHTLVSPKNNSHCLAIVFCYLGEE